MITDKGHVCSHWTWNLTRTPFLFSRKQFITSHPLTHLSLYCNFPPRSTRLQPPVTLFSSPLSLLSWIHDHFTQQHWWPWLKPATNSQLSICDHGELLLSYIHAQILKPPLRFITPSTFSVIAAKTRISLTFFDFKNPSLVLHCHYNLQR